MIITYINHLLDYGISNKLIDEYDRQYVFNRLLELFKIDDPKNAEYAPSNVKPVLSTILEFMTAYATDKKLISDSQASKELFDTKIMAVLTPFPSNVISKFNKLYEISPKHATDYFYGFCKVCNYIRVDRIEKDIKWQTFTEYGNIDITINLSKPEKDPRDIAAQKNAVSSSYPKCLLCIENEGYSGRINHPARQNLRLIPLKLNNEAWSFQYSPYVYYNEHCIVLNNLHIPMKIDENTFVKLLEFVDIFPHYFIGSNADLPIVGGSILSHDHFQGGNYEFAMAKAPIEDCFKIKRFEDVEFGIVKWPMSVIRLRHAKKERLIDIASFILNRWRNYTDKEVFIIAHTDAPHNTITPIARKKDDLFELDLVLRNNITTEEHTLGVYHPHSQYHHIKKENIGLIEVMGLAVLPSRLKTELEIIKNILLKKAEYCSEIAHHNDWIASIMDKYKDINNENIDLIIQDEIGKIFTSILANAGVFKRDDKGRKAFVRFIESLSLE